MKDGDTMMRKGGFTLIEVLIVVVIIGILAALVVPRMLSAPDKAMVAEANQLLGAIIRGQQRNLDTEGSFVEIADNTSQLIWDRVGVIPPGVSVNTGTGPKFNYTCTAATSDCRASRNPGAVDAANKWINVTLDGVWSCGSAYTVMANGGCSGG